MVGIGELVINRKGGGRVTAQVHGQATCYRLNLRADNGEEDCTLNGEKNDTLNGVNGVTSVTLNNENFTLNGDASVTRSSIKKEDLCIEDLLLSEERSINDRVLGPTHTKTNLDNPDHAAEPGCFVLTPDLSSNPRVDTVFKPEILELHGVDTRKRVSPAGSQPSPSKPASPAKSPKRKFSLWPDGFALTEELRQVARKHGRDPDREWERFHAHAEMNEVEHVNWPAAWRYWCSNGYGRNGAAPLPVSTSAPKQKTAADVRRENFGEA